MSAAAARKLYPTDLTDLQWTIVEPLIPPAKAGGRPRAVDMREVVNAILYLNRSGCQWDMLPHDLPPKSDVYFYFARWREDGTWRIIVDTLRARVRTEVAGREATPSAASVDSQTVKTAGQPATATGYDGAKKITGRKRHLVVDTLGLLLVVAASAASADDGTFAPEVLGRLTAEHCTRLELIWADSKYHNHHLIDWLVTTETNYWVEVIGRPAGSVGFVTLPRRWVVERTFAWHTLTEIVVPNETDTDSRNATGPSSTGMRTAG